MSKRLEPHYENLFAKQSGMQQMMQMFGITMPGMPGQAAGGAPAQQWQPPAITHRKRNETEGGK